MARYFLEITYNGKGYAGFQVQKNAVTIQSETEHALKVFFRQPIHLTGSSRTDAGVHALQNYFHFDFEGRIDPAFVYNLNAILPPAIAIRRIIAMPEGAHARFHAISREYHYFIYQSKNPFLEDRACYFPYGLDFEAMQESAAFIAGCHDFTSFSKRRTQAKNFLCELDRSEWLKEEECHVYRVRGNRFLRGMVRGLVGTMLQVGQGKISISDLKEIVARKDCRGADFSVPGHGLFLVAVNFPEGYFGDISR
jgi:tRNA pseudouridine38-40 synthase